LQKGLSYEAYAERLASAAQAAADKSLEHDARRLAEYAKLNWHRSRRIQKTYNVSAALSETVQAIVEKRFWIILTEPWCGDSAQCLPYLAKIAACNPRIELRILLRDENLDIIDQYLTEGKRGIPKLVAFDTEGRELFRWGPRPRGAVAIVKRGREAGKAKDEYIEDLHRWYAQDQGRSIEEEILELLRS